MMDCRAAVIGLLIGGLMLTLYVTATGQSGIVVEGADSLLDTSIVYSPDLVKSIQSVDPRVAVEYARSTAPRELVELPTTLQSLLNSVAERVVTQYASSNRVEITAYPLELMNDTTPPRISEIGLTPGGSGSINVTWTTDEFATTVVYYGTQPGEYPDTVSDPYFVKQHSVALSDLAPRTTYYLLVSSTDQSGNTATSAEHSFSTALHIAKSVTPQGQVDYGDELTYSLVISTMLETQAGLYDPLEGTTFVHFVQQPGNVTYDDGVITGTLTVPSDDQVTVSFVVQVDVPSAVGSTVEITNRACIYPTDGTIEDDCIWSNQVNNEAFRPQEVYLPLVVRTMR